MNLTRNFLPEKLADFPKINLYATMEINTREQFLHIQNNTERVNIKLFNIRLEFSSQ